MQVDTYIRKSRDLLRRCQSQFRSYGEQHRAKLDNPDLEPAARAATISKAEANERFVARIQEFLDEVGT